jgi:hypothetical protein
MIKKILIGLIFLLAGIVKVNAQCSPNPNDKGEGLSPDSAIGFATGYVGQAYQQLVTINVPQDTIVVKGFPGIPFDSVVLNTLTGLPKGFTWVCNFPRCSWLGNTSGCMLISGNPTLADTGTNHLVYTASAYVGGSKTATPIVLKYYFIKILPPTGIQELSMNHFDVLQNYPNPFSGNTEFKFSIPEPGEVQVNIYNVLGKLVYANLLKAVVGQNEFAFERGNLAPGIYTYRFAYKQEVLTGRMAAE